MSAKSVPPRNSRPATHRAKTGISDIFAVAAGFALIAIIGWVAYRTQIVGEPVEKVIPFLVYREPAPADSPGGTPAPEGSPSGDVAPAAVNDPVAKPAAHPDDPATDNTYFGRRVSPASRH